MSPTADDLDRTLAQSFPASDPPAASSPTVAIAPDDDEPGPRVALYRLVDEGDVDRAFASQAQYRAGRWSSEDTPVLYASTSEALATLEYLAHLEGRTPGSLVLVSAKIPDRLVWRDPPLPGEWHRVPYDDRVRGIGDRWVAQGACPVILVPSVHAHGEYNALVLPTHPQAWRIRVDSRRPVSLDPRLRT